MTIYVDACLRLAGAIGLDTVAFVIWNVGTRSPTALIRDVRRNRAFFSGAVRALAGIVFMTAATVLVVPAAIEPSRDLVPALLLSLIPALAIELLVGDDLRRLATGAMRSA